MYTLQTGSGKTYTMGTAFNVSGEDELVGIVPRAVEQLFIGIQQRQQAAHEQGIIPPEFKVNAQFMEVFDKCFIFTAQCNAERANATANHPSVCLSIRLSHSGIVVGILLKVI